MNCSYCHRDKEHNVVLNYDFIDSLATEKPFISFRGGEPLVYMEEIKEIIIRSNASGASIVTNGKNIENYIEDLKAYNIRVHISYDFDNGAARSFIPNFHLPIDFDVRSTLYSGNCDMIRWTNEHWEICSSIGKWFAFYPHIIHYTDESNMHLKLTYNDYDYIVEQYEKALIDSDNLKLLPLRLRVALAKEKRYAFGETRCMNRNSLRYDIDGNLYSCSYIKRHFLKDFSDVQYRQNIINSLSTHCANCNLYQYCGAGCIECLNPEEECYFNKKAYALIDKYITKDYRKKIQFQVESLSSGFFRS